MVDSTKVIFPAAQAFLSGKLEMQQTLSAGTVMPAENWTGCTVNTVAVIVLVITGLLVLNSYIRMLPLLTDCLFRWKASIRIDSSIRLKDDRNILALVSLLALVIISDRFSFFSIGMLDSLPQQWSLPGTAAVIIAWVVLRGICYFLCSRRAPRPDTFRTAHTSPRNILILAVTLMVFTAGVIILTDIQDEVGRTILMYEAALLYLIAILRERQILVSACNHFLTFLYLCALELLPTGALIAGNILL